MGVLRVERSVRSGSSQSRYSQSRSSQANPAGERLRLEIAGLSSDGSGIARTDRGVVFVAGALPGELVEAELVKRRKNFALARTVSVMRPSPGRTAPRCSAFGQCGGCQLQHADYPLQLSLKAGLVRDAMTRLGGFAPELFENLECVPSPLPWGYRNKASFPVQSLRGRIVTGFYHAGSHRLIPIKTCPVNAAPLNALYGTVLKGLPSLPFGGYDETTHEGKLRHLVMRSGFHTGQTLLSFVLNGRLAAKGIKALVAVGASGRPSTLTLNHNSRPGNVILGTHTEPLIGSGRIAERLDEWTLEFDTTSFFQVNTGQAEQLFRYAAEQVRGTDVLELYSGVGSLTCFLASRACGARVTAVEEWRSAVTMAERNMRANGLEARLLCAPAEEAVGDLRGSYGTVVLDPPRDGCDRAVLEAIHAFRASRVVYVSCNPATLARDARILAGHGYRLTSIRSFDMFPQTVHVETVAVMER